MERSVRAAVAAIRERSELRPQIGLVLGSGMGALADAFEESERIPFAEIPGFAVPNVEGHAGRLVLGRLEGVPCIALQGRYHLYEGHAPEAVALPARVMIELGARTMIVTNAAGALNRSYATGDLMILADHINLLGRNPLVGAVVAGEERFPDMTQAYDVELQALAEEAARTAGVVTHRGVYVAVLGPSYETPAEIRMLQMLGGDAVGMSTVPEVVVSRARGVRVLGLSLITNAAAGTTAALLSHAEVIAAGAAAAGRLETLMRTVVRRLGSG